MIIDPPRPTWLDDLEGDGVAVVPGAIPLSDVKAFERSAYDWLGTFSPKFDRADKRTWTKEIVPSGWRVGMFSDWGVQHEAFVWRTRSQPGILSAFAAAWGVSPDDLVASYDGINISFPLGKHGRTDVRPTAPWPHVDQDPATCDRFELYQGIAVLSPSGPDDGGLCVMKRSHLLHPAYFAAHPPPASWAANRIFKMSDAAMRWYAEHGAIRIKVCAQPGDLVLWDSRVIHWNASPTGKETQLAAYVCYCPRAVVDEDVLVSRVRFFYERTGTNHKPNVAMPGKTVLPRLEEPEETPAVLRLIGSA